MNTEAYLMLVALPFAVGALGFLLRHSVIITFMSVELILSTANLVFATFARQHGKLDGQMTSFFTMVMAAVEAMVGLTIIVAVYRTRHPASVDNVNLLKL